MTGACIRCPKLKGAVAPVAPAPTRTLKYWPMWPLVSFSQPTFHSFLFYFRQLEVRKQLPIPSCLMYSIAQCEKFINIHFFKKWCTKIMMKRPIFAYKLIDFYTPKVSYHPDSFLSFEQSLNLSKFSANFLHLGWFTIYVDRA